MAVSDAGRQMQIQVLPSASRDTLPFLSLAVDEALDEVAAVVVVLIMLISRQHACMYVLTYAGFGGAFWCI